MLSQGERMNYLAPQLLWFAHFLTYLCLFIFTPSFTLHPCSSWASDFQLSTAKNHSIASTGLLYAKAANAQTVGESDSYLILELGAHVLAMQDGAAGFLIQRSSPHNHHQYFPNWLDIDHQPDTELGCFSTLQGKNCTGEETDHIASRDNFTKDLDWKHSMFWS